MAKTIPFPAGKTAPKPGNRPAAKIPEPPPEDGAAPAELRERRDQAMARRLGVQNEITRGVLIPQEDVKRVLSGVSGSWRGRESLYKSLSQGGNPSFETILKVLSSLGFGLRPAPVSSEA